MSLNSFAVQEEISDRLKTIPFDSTTTIKLYEGAVSDEEMAEYVEAQGIRPFLVVNYSSLGQPPIRHKGLCGSKNNIKELQVVVQSVADTSRNARRLLAQANSLVDGFSPLGAGEIQPALFLSTGAVNFLGSPTRYSAVQSYSLFVDSDPQ